jgi:hypothetical protein
MKPIREEEIDDILKQIVDMKGNDYLIKKSLEFTESEIRSKRIKKGKSNK